MADSLRPTKGVHQGPRSRRVVAAVHAATLHELGRVGFAGLTMDGVATRAGVHRSTVYRRWPSKVALVADLLDTGAEALAAAPASGSLAEVLGALGRRLAGALHAPEGRALAALLPGGPPELRALSRAARLRVQQPYRDAFDRAVAGGLDLAPAAVDDRVHLLFFGLVHAVLDGDGPLDGARVDRLVAVALAGLPAV